MKRAALLVGLLLVPVGVQGQVEVGFDAGLTLDNYEFSESLTTIGIPTGTARIGFAAGETITVETLMNLSRLSSDGDSFTTISLIPGVNVALGDGGFYLRGEAGLMRVSFGGEFSDGSETQYTLGAAGGLKRAIGDGPISFRLEAGLGKWLEDEDAGLESFTRIRLLFGFSAELN